MKKIKPCKGNYKVNYYEGCGSTDGFFRRYGLCATCLYDWSQSTSDGQEWADKQKINNKRKQSSQNAKEKKKALDKMMSKTAYISKYLQPVINEIARLIDHEQPCIVRGVENVKMDGGHYFSVNSNKTISLNLHNIHQQSNDSNKWEGGCPQYRIGIVNTYGEDYANFIDSLHQTPLIKLSRQEIEDITIKARKARNRLKKDVKKITNPKDRIRLRNRINLELNIYPVEFSVFKSEI